MAHGFLQSFNPGLDVEVMKEAGIDISGHSPKNVSQYIDEEWDYVVTVCDDAQETCPIFPGKVHHRLHMGFEDPSKVTGTPEFIRHEYLRVRDEIRQAFTELYSEQIKNH